MASAANMGSAAVRILMSTEWWSWNDVCCQNNIQLTSAAKITVWFLSLGSLTIITRKKNSISINTTVYWIKTSLTQD